VRELNRIYPKWINDCTKPNVKSALMLAFDTASDQQKSQLKQLVKYSVDLDKANATIREQQSQLRLLAEAVLECHGNDCSYYIECTCPVCELAREVQYAESSLFLRVS